MTTSLRDHVRAALAPGRGGVTVGVDLVGVRRFAGLLARRGDLLTDRVFSARELADAAGSPRRLAARFAAKEATAKALGVGIGPVAWRDVEVRTAVDGGPRLRLRGAAARLAAARHLTDWTVSLSHDGTSAVAVVVARRSGGAR